MKRRTFLHSTLSASAAGLAASAGLLRSGTVLANTPDAESEPNSEINNAFKADNLEAAMEAVGIKNPTESDAIAIKAPEIAENGAVVPVTVSSAIEGAKSITIIVSNNPTPLAAVFNLGEGAVATASTRLKMGKTSDVIAVVKTADAAHMAKQEVKVTIGGCGG